MRPRRLILFIACLTACRVGESLPTRPPTLQLTLPSPAFPTVDTPSVDRESLIPAGAVKVTSATDPTPPQVLSAEYERPIPIPGAVNTAGGEDSPFITPDGNTLYFFFTPDGTELWLTRNYGLWRSVSVAGEWQPPEQILSSLAGEASIDSAGNVYFVHHFFKDDQMIEADIYVAYKK